MFEFAPKSTQVTLDSGTAIENGNPIKVWGFLFEETTAGTAEVVDIQSADGTVTYFRIRLLPNTLNTYRNLFSTPWIADKGLKFVAVSGDMTVSITVYHSQAGG